MKSIELLVFDLDGTLVDSKKDIVRAVNWTLAQHRAQLLPEAVIEAHVGKGVRPLMEDALRKAKVEPLTKALSSFDENQGDSSVQRAHLLPGILEILKLIDLPEGELADPSNGSTKAFKSGDKNVGKDLRALLEEALRKAKAGSLADALASFDHYYLEHCADETRLYPGILEVLSDVDIPKVILTNKSDRFAKPLLETLGVSQKFLAIYGRESFQTYKPDPGPLREISKLHKVPLSQMLMIGDTEVDLLAGKRAGSQTCGVLYGYGTESELTEQSPTFLVKTPEALLQELKKLCIKSELPAQQ